MLLYSYFVKIAKLHLAITCFIVQQTVREIRLIEKPTQINEQFYLRVILEQSHVIQYKLLNVYSQHMWDLSYILLISTTCHRVGDQHHRFKSSTSTIMVPDRNSGAFSRNRNWTLAKFHNKISFDPNHEEIVFEAHFIPNITT